VVDPGTFLISEMRREDIYGLTKWVPGRGGLRSESRDVQGVKGVRDRVSSATALKIDSFRGIKPRPENAGTILIDFGIPRVFVTGIAKGVWVHRRAPESRLKVR
jgi:hypothetical protein